MFKITAGKGFRIIFENGWAISVQFGGGHYCDNYDDEIGREAWIESGKKGSPNAECAVFNSNGELIYLPPDEEDQVTYRSTPAEVLELMNFAASQPKHKKTRAYNRLKRIFYLWKGKG